ncbi:hypothetical protein CC86DRAFT_166045 [Ophiobolus disseminans]|uniref:Uncharacterized protein n=1 Tax=Ophiobolus disseminans TaxID=1469910 RepID=A0A6A7ABK4_9PLEO|nr:hypothetical protein CC86DRAFT_166045 [Ophiobolus disseminans]
MMFLCSGRGTQHMRWDVRVLSGELRRAADVYVEANALNHLESFRPYVLVRTIWSTDKNIFLRSTASGENTANKIGDGAMQGKHSILGVPSTPYGLFFYKLERSSGRKASERAFSSVLAASMIPHVFSHSMLSSSILMQSNLISKHTPHSHIRIHIVPELNITDT